MGAKLPQDTPTIAAIYEKWALQNSPPRPYLGASIIGEACERKLWYSFRWSAQEIFDGRMLRLFDTGQKEEARVVKDLRDVGIKVWDIDDRTGEQFRVSAIYGHAGGGMDAVGKGFIEAPKTIHVIEIKTHNEKSFRKLQSEGVEKSKPMHYAQMTLYMRWNDLDRAFYIARNKDTDELYGERVTLVPRHAEILEERAARIIFAPKPLPKISDDPAWYECKFCPAYSICHGKKIPPASCRTCVHATPEKDGDGRWTCALRRIDLSIDDQRKGCESHRFIPGLIPYKQTDASGEENWIEYEVTHKGETKKIRNGPHGHDSYESTELHFSAPAAFFDQETADMRRNFDARLKGFEPCAA